MNEAVRKTAVFLSGIAVVLLLLEAGLRVNYILQQNRLGRHAAGTSRTVLCVGDSFVYGLGAPPGMSFPSQLQRLLGPGYAVINMGQGGQNTVDVLNDLGHQIDTVDPDVVVILCGGANLWNLRGSKDYLNAKGRSGAVRWLADTRTGHLVKLLSAAVKNRQEGGRVTQQAVKAETTVPVIEPQRKKAWRNYPDLRTCTDAEIAAWGKKYEDGIRSDPGDTANYQGLGLICAYRRDYAAAIDHFKTAARKDPEDTRNYIEMGRIYDEMGRYEEAITFLRKAIEIYPGEYNAYEPLGHVYLHLRRDRDALNAFRKANELTPAGHELRYNGIVLVSHEARDEETRREALAYLHGSGNAGEIAASSLQRRMRKKKNGMDDGLKEWIQDDIGEMIGMCDDRDVRVMLLNYPSEIEGIDVNGILREAARKRSVPFVDNAALFDDMFSKKKLQRKDFFAPDGHCNAKGYGVMAMNVYDAMSRHGYVKRHE